MNVNDTYKFYNNVEIPVIGFGTWQIKNPEIAYNSVKHALEAGYRHIDTASIYGNEESVGRAILDSNINRNEIFLTTKLWNDAHSYDKALKAIDVSLKKLKTDYVDLYLIHWPNPIEFRNNYEKSLIETWRAMEDIYKSGKAKAIGISNFKYNHIELLLDNCEIAPMVNQIRVYPGYEKKEFIESTLSHGMLVEAYSPLGTGSLIEVEEIKEIASKYNKSVAQLLIRYSLQKGYIPLPKSQTKERIIENINVFDFNIDENDMNYISKIKDYGTSYTDPDLIEF